MVPIVNEIGSVSVDVGSVVVSKSELDSGVVVVVEKSSSKLNVVVEGTVVDVVAPMASVRLPESRVEVSELSNVTEIVELVLVV